MAESREFLFISNFARCIKLLTAKFPQARKVFERTSEGEAGYGAELRLALDRISQLRLPIAYTSKDLSLKCIV